MPRTRLGTAVLAGAVGAALLAGCEGTRSDVRDFLGESDNEPRTLAFECDDDRDFSVRLSGDRDEARVDAGEDTYELNLTGRDDGRRVYSNEDDVRLTIGDAETNLRIPGGEDYRNCERV